MAEIAFAICAGSEENILLARIFDEHRDSMRNTLCGFLMAGDTE